MFYFVLGVIAFIALITYSVIQTKKNQEILKKDFEEALKNYDKKAALEAGRKYYASIRPGGKLTIYDEQALTNDISTMKTKQS